MNITLQDRTKAELGWTKDGCRTIEYKALKRSIVLPYAMVATIGLVQRLYNALKEV